ncbi:MAG: hypothetical protein HY872_13910 [Chloroflexi bacterium]|nr:hypothetical protein [Chloroflexota bacterium]
MDLQHLSIKVFAERPETIDLSNFTGVFNSWIQRRVADELLIDVADYSHVFAGPGVILIGHEANYSLDNAGRRLGLLYNRKAKVEGTTHERLRQAARAALLACQRLEKEQALKFSGQEMRVIVNDRLIAPNTDETFTSLAPEFKSFFDTLYRGAEYLLNPTPDPRERLTVNVRAASRFDVETLLRNLS